MRNKHLSCKYKNHSIRTIQNPYECIVCGYVSNGKDIDIICPQCGSEMITHSNSKYNLNKIEKLCLTSLRKNQMTKRLLLK